MQEGNCWAWGGGGGGVCPVFPTPGSPWYASVHGAYLPQQSGNVNGKDR